jgi:hypothetical protein
MAKLSWQRIAKHSTGIPNVAGATWNPPTSEMNVAKKLLFYLEDRGVLYNDLIIEAGEQVESSAREMRGHLRRKLQEKIEPNSRLADIARDMQAACRAFLDETKRHRPGSPGYLGQGWRSDSQWVAALGAFRVQLGRCIARLAVEYHLNVEGKLVSILSLGAQAHHKEAPPDDAG